MHQQKQHARAAIIANVPQQSQQSHSQSNNSNSQLDQLSQLAYKSLHSIPKLPSNHVIKLTSKSTIPPYTSWVPVQGNIAVHSPAEAYLPYTGDIKDVSDAAALEAFNLMRSQERNDSAFDLLSDGEPYEDGLFKPDDNTLHSYYFPPKYKNSRILDDKRHRAAQRYAALNVIDKYGQNITTLNALRTALQIHQKYRVEAIIKLAKERRAETTQKQLRIQNSQHHAAQIATASAYPYLSNISPRVFSYARAPLQYFCFTCHKFMCDLHDCMRPIPRKKILDPVLERRAKEIQEGDAAPCSSYCYLLPIESRRVDDPETSQWLPDWDEDDEGSLREALLLYGRDPCNLATLIGTKSCIDVHRKLGSSYPQLFGWLKAAEDLDKHHATTIEWGDQIWKQMEDKTTVEESSSSDSVTKKTKSHAKSKKKKNRRGPKPYTPRTIRKTTGLEPIEEEPFDLGEANFIPCNHEGPCTLENCRCKQKSRCCLATCACNTSRYCYCSLTDSIKREGADCENTSIGCNCPGGACEPETCQCYVANESTCSSDVCSCDCRLPSDTVGVRERKCKNFDIFRHKRTYMGRSHVEGFGLFAGEHFEKGDLVGVYRGAQLPFSIADGVNAISHVTERTFAFDVRDVTVDGRTLGAKMKFANHGEPAETRNCKPEDVWVKGHAYLRVVTTRGVNPGEEFLFDYNLNGKKDPSWLIKEREAVDKPRTENGMKDGKGNGIRDEWDTGEESGEKGATNNGTVP